MHIELNGRTISLVGVFPFRMKDFKVLERLGLLHGQGEGGKYTLAQTAVYALYVLQKADESVREEEIDNLTPAEFGELLQQITAALPAAPGTPPFSSTSSTSSAEPTAGP